MLKALRMVRKSYIAVTRFKINTDLKKKKLIPPPHSTWDLYMYFGQNMKCSMQHRALEVWMSDKVAKFHRS